MTPPSIADSFVETGEMAVQLKSLVALAKDPTWVPSSIPDSSPRGLLPFSDLHRHQAHMWYTYFCEAKYIYTKINFKN